MSGLITSHPLDLLLSGVHLPLCYINQSGQCISGNTAGKKRFDELYVLLDGLTPRTIITQEKLFINCQKQGIPTWVATDSAVILFHAIQKPSTESAPLELMHDAPAALIQWIDDFSPYSEREKLCLVQEVSQAVNSSLILEDIFEALGDVLYRYFSYHTAKIVILDNSQNTIKILVELSNDGSLIITGENNAFVGYEPLVDEIVKNPHPKLFLKGQTPDSALLPTTSSSALIVPLINKGVVIGLIAMSTQAEQGFYHYQEVLLSEVSAQLTIAVENAKLYLQTQTQAMREFMINQLTQSIRQSFDIETILSTVAKAVIKLTGASRCLIHYFEPHFDASVSSEKQGSRSTQFFQAASHGILPLPDDFRQQPQDVFHMRGTSGVYNPFILNDVRDGPAALNLADFQEKAQVKSMALFPVLSRDRLVGTITLHQCDAYRTWVNEDISLLSALSEHLGVALNQAHLFGALQIQKEALEKTLQELQKAQLYLVQSEKMAILGQFVAGIAHEVNTPLGIIVSNQQTLKQCIAQYRAINQNPAQEDQNQKLHETIDSLLSLSEMASTRITEIVKNLRNFVRLDESALKTVNIHDGIDSTIMLVKSSLHPKIQIECNYEKTLPLVQCYPGLLNQVIMNLLVNAGHALADRLDERNTDRQFSPKISISTQLKPTENSDELTDITVLIAVKDNGKGIVAENLPKIFDPGFTTKGSGVGTGLGLALCYQIIEKHRGKIAVKSVPNQETCFVVEIPVSTF
ncbi:MAG: GAF domain-containing protein [Cyanobacteria bacterium P01_H01_bin.74]